jgi:serine/threonine protein kinase
MKPLLIGSYLGARTVLHTRLLRWQLERRHGIVNVHEFRRATWHLGSRYYTAVERLTGTVLFVKTSGRSLIRNEVTAWRRLDAGPAADFVPRMHAFDYECRVPFAASELIDAVSLSAVVESCDSDTAAALAQELLRIVDLLHLACIVHRDLRPGNLLLRRQPAAAGRLVLIDFAFAVVDTDDSGDADVLHEALLTLGDGLNPAPLTWDDAYSAYQILLMLERTSGRALAETAQMRERIGRLSHRAGTHL